MYKERSTALLIKSSTITPILKGNTFLGQSTLGDPTDPHPMRQIIEDRVWTLN
jgi:hypothetical protein